MTRTMPSRALRLPASDMPLRGAPLHCHFMRSSRCVDESFRVHDNKIVFSGPVAQLGARFHGMEEVVGSIPTRSTNKQFTINELGGHTVPGILIVGSIWQQT
jgi:hypothetical protein